jgi:hypothetical protein
LGKNNWFYRVSPIINFLPGGIAVGDRLARFFLAPPGFYIDLLGSVRKVGWRMIPVRESLSVEILLAVCFPSSVGSGALELVLNLRLLCFLPPIRRFSPPSLSPWDTPRLLRRAQKSLGRRQKSLRSQNQNKLLTFSTDRCIPDGMRFVAKNTPLHPNFCNHQPDFRTDPSFTLIRRFVGGGCNDTL